MSTQLFLHPRLIGARFEGHAIPMEFLKDLAALEEMIVEVAKAEFLKDHPGRQRVPPGFAKDVELKLTGIEEGSAVLAISLDAAPDQEFPIQDRTYFNRRDAIICFERARDIIVSVIGAADQNQSFANYLPKKILRHFGKFGRSLRDNEIVEFITPSHDARAKLTKKAWLRLVHASSENDKLIKETSIRGSVFEADQDNMTFEVQPIVGQKVKAPIPPQHLDTILEALRGYKKGARVLLHGMGRFDQVNHLRGFDSIKDVRPLDPLDITARLEELRLLKNGWLEGGGRALSHEGLDWLSRTFERHYSENLPPPYLYPTEEGGVQAEWSLGPKEVSLEIELRSHSGEWHALDMETDAVSERTLNINNANDWKWLVEQIRQMNEEGG